MCQVEVEADQLQLKELISARTNLYLKRVLTDNLQRVISYEVTPGITTKSNNNRYCTKSSHNQRQSDWSESGDSQ